MRCRTTPRFQKENLQIYKKIATQRAPEPALDRLRISQKKQAKRSPPRTDQKIVERRSPFKKRLGFWDLNGLVCWAPYHDGQIRNEPGQSNETNHSV